MESLEDLSYESIHYAKAHYPNLCEVWRKQVYSTAGTFHQGVNFRQFCHWLTLALAKFLSHEFCLALHDGYAEDITLVLYLAPHKLSSIHAIKVDIIRWFCVITEG